MLVLGFAAAAPGSAAQVWEPAVRISHDASEALMGPGGFTADGDFVAVWNEVKPPALPQVFAAVKTDGQGFTPPTSLGDSAFFPAVAFDGVGNTLAAWEYEPAVGGRQTRQRILVATRPPGGEFAPPVDIGQGQGGIAIAANQRGDAVVFWSQYRDDGRRHFASVKPAGGTFGPPEDVSGLVPSAYLTEDIDVALTPTGDALFAWQDSQAAGDVVSAIKAAWRPLSGPVMPAQTLSTPGTRGYGPKVAVDGAGRGVVTWVEMSPDTRAGPVMAAVSDRLGPFNRHALGASASRDEPPDMGVSSAGEVIVAWSEHTPIPGDPHSTQGGSLLTVIGNTQGEFDEPVPLSGRGGGARVTVEPDGHALVAFTGGNLELFAARRMPGLPFSVPRAAHCPPPGAVVTAVAIAPEGTGAVLWAEGAVENGDRALMFSREVASDTDAPAECPGLPSWPPPDGPGSDPSPIMNLRVQADSTIAARVGEGAGYSRALL